jgi:tetrahydromethanopterin S-methyltransferase subunit G
VSTYDDRLTALEQRVTALSHNLVSTQSDIFTHFAGFNRTAATLNSMISEQEMDTRDLHHNTGILLGVARDQGRDIKSIKEDLRTVKGDLDTAKDDLGDVKVSVKAHDQRFDSVDQEIKQGFSEVKQRFEAQGRRFDGVDQRLDSLDKKFDQVLSILSKLIPGAQQET